MKKILLFLLFRALTFSCSSDSYSKPALSDTPQAKAEFDNSNFEIYKGVL